MKNKNTTAPQTGKKPAKTTTRRTAGTTKPGSPSKTAAKTEITLAPKRKDAATWQAAAGMSGKPLEEWIAETIGEAAFNIVNKERIEAILDLRAFEKGASGAYYSWDEFQRSQRYKANHPAEAKRLMKTILPAPPPRTELTINPLDSDRERWCQTMYDQGFPDLKAWAIQRLNEAVQPRDGHDSNWKGIGHV